MAGIELDRLESSIGVDLTDLRSGLAEAQNATAAAAENMARSFETAGRRTSKAFNLNDLSSVSEATRKAREEAEKLGQSAEKTGSSARVLGIQLGQVAQQGLATGQYLQALAIQLPDISAGMSAAGKSTNAFVSFLSGPWGIALTTAAAVGISLASSMWKNADAAKAAAEAADELKEATDRLANATATANHQTRQGIIDDINKANSMRLREIQTRKTLQAELEAARARESSFNTTAATGIGVIGGTVSGASSAEADRQRKRAEDLQRQIDAQDKKIAEANTAIRTGQAQIVQRDVAAGSNRSTANDQRLQDQTDKLTRDYETNRITLAQYKAGLRAATDAHTAEAKQISDDAKAPGRARAEQRREEAAARREAAQQRREQNEEYRHQREFQKAEASAQADLAAQIAGLSGSYQDRAAAERAAAQQQHDAAQDQIISNRDFTNAQKARLIALNDEALALRERKIEMDRQRAADAQVEAAAKASAELEAIRAETDRTILQQQEAAAQTAGQRQALAVRIVEADAALAEAREREIIASAERVLASNAATEAEKIAAQAAIDQANGRLEGIQRALPGQIAAARNQNPNVLSADGFGKALGENLQQGVIEALQGKNLKDAMRDGIFSVLNNAMSEAVKDLTSTIFKGGVSALGSLFSSVFGGARAVGGPALAGAAYDVGNGEKFVPGANGRILSRQDAMDALGGTASGRPGMIEVRISGARGNQEIQQMVREGVQQGIAQYDRVVGDRVDTSFRRRG